MTKQALMAWAMAAVLAGCASTPGGMRTDADAKRVAMVEANYQLVLKRLVDHWAECGPQPVLPIGQAINDVQHYPDLRQASIVRGGQGFGTQILHVIDLRETAPGRTEMVTYTKVATDTFAARMMRVAGGASGC